MDLDKSMIGLEGEVSVVEVEKGHIRRFAEAIGDPNPLYVDEEYASKTPYGGIIAPPTFPVALRQENGGVPLKLDHRRMLHGEQEFIYYRPIRAGDRLYLKSKVSDLYEREGKSGSMQFLVLDVEIKDDAGEMVAISRMNIIYRRLKSK
ncbi:MaoC family dehydratase N-terminal domain-containing protein [Neobacillus vireti]|uniref:MaoC family dehydratase N-terminal domain-containing protein n=1 Tax=Neobacillus vireti TaxID=220686 RepID=UPI002FFDC177